MIPIYTAIYGGYDKLQPINCDDNRFKHICVSDSLPADLNGWCPAIKIVSGESPLVMSRRVKFLAYKMFSVINRAKVSVYIDGSLMILDYDLLYDLCQKLLNNPAVDMIMPQSRKRNNIVTEAIQAISWGRVSPDAVLKEMRYIYGRGFCGSTLTASCGFRITKINKYSSKFLGAWFDHFNRFQTRDQISFPFIAWKLNYDRYKLFGSSTRNRLFKKMDHLK